MPRNVERDILREQERRKNIIKAGFELFSQNGIENVSLKEVADKAEVGIATLYNYYQDKISLVTAISASMWSWVWEDYVDRTDQDIRDSFLAYQIIESYLDSIIELYQKHPEILRFSGDYKTFIKRHDADEGKLKEHLDAVIPINNAFHLSYKKGILDNSIRTDIPPKELFTTVAITMLGMAERYAQGIVWNKNQDGNYTNELLYLKEMILEWVKKRGN